MDIPDAVEIRFKNTRKGFYRNVNGLRLKRGDIVAVEASPGHDIGIVSLGGEIVDKQLNRAKHTGNPEELKKVYRKAKQVDIDKWQEAIRTEEFTMLQSRKLASDSVRSSALTISSLSRLSFTGFSESAERPLRDKQDKPMSRCNKLII